MIHLLRGKATPIQLQEMSEALSGYLKVAVDIRQELLAGGGIMHADCEAVLLEAGSKQEDLWGADWIPDEREVRFEALINIRPRQDNRSMEIQDQGTRLRVEKIMRDLLEV